MAQEMDPLTAVGEDARLVALVDLVGRTGAASFTIAYAEPEAGEDFPVTWHAHAEYKRDGRTVWQVGADYDPVRAVFRLVETLVDGGQCQHCKRPTGVTLDADEMPAGELVCWYQYDPELITMRRGCE